MTEYRPLPCVIESRCGTRWSAYLPINQRKQFLGHYGSPEQARAAVLSAQAEHLEARAARYRAQAEELMS